MLKRFADSLTINLPIMKTISIKKVWISTSGWRGHEEPVNAVGGANDTGTWSDSPCPSGKREREIKGFCRLLKVNGINYKTTWCKSSNVFCMAQYVCVHPDDREKAEELADAFAEETDLFYPVIHKKKVEVA